MSMRKKEVGEEIRKVISERLVRGLKDPCGFVTIQDVEVNKDFSRFEGLLFCFWVGC